MRKLYALLAGVCFVLNALPLHSQQSTPDVANFSFTIDVPGNSVLFVNTSVLGNAPGTRKAFWSFGDGTGQWTGPLQGAIHHYASSGSFTVCLKIYRYGSSPNDSVLTAQVCKTVVLESVCHANFERIPLTTSNDPLRVNLHALPAHTQNKKPVKICWTFGDGRDTCIVYSNTNPGPYNVQHTYAAPGVYEVCIKIFYEDGCDARRCKPIQVERTDSCAADFEKWAVATTNHPLSVIYKAITAHNNDRKPARICWTFGDGRDTCINYEASHTGPYFVTHDYNEPGIYEVCIKIVYYGGCEARKCKEVRVSRPDTCTARFEKIPVTSTNNNLVTAFRALPWHNNGKKPARICWTFGDGRDTCIQYGQDYNGPYTVGHVYHQPGQYEVCVKILYYGGCEARYCQLINIPHRPCAVTIHEVTPSLTSLVRGFYAALTSEPDSRPVRICWNFGDGTDTCILATTTNPPDLLVRHNYPGPGVYRACVRVVFANNCVAEDCEEVVIRTSTGVCGGYMTDSLTGPRSFKFKGFAIHIPNDQVLSYRWSFGDGSTGIGREISHTYEHGGDYEVCLYIKTVLGCETRICKTIRVPGNNEPHLVLTPNPVQNVLHAQFWSTHTETVTIKLINSNGVVIRTVTRNAVTGANSWDFDTSSLLPGVYSLRVQSANQVASALFIKL